MAVRRASEHNGFVIMFDDGFKDNLAAVDIAARNGASVCVALTTDLIGAQCLIPLHTFYYLHWKLGARAVLAATNEQAGIPEGSLDRADAVTARAMVEHAIGDQIGSAPAQRVVAKLEKQCEDSSHQYAAWAQRLYLTWDDVRLMISRGACIAAHSCSHRRLSALDRKEIEREVTTCKRIIEHETGIGVNAFVYPFGERTSVHADADDVLLRSGFSMAFTAERTWLDGGPNAFAIPRLVVGNWPAWRLAFELLFTDGIDIT